MPQERGANRTGSRQSEMPGADGSSRSCEPAAQPLRLEVDAQAGVDLSPDQKSLWMATPAKRLKSRGTVPTSPPFASPMIV